MVIYTDGHLLGANNLFSEFCANEGYTQLILDNKPMKVEYKKQKLTNNEAELLAVIHACFFAKKGDVIITDSMYAYDWTLGRKTSKIERLLPLIAAAQSCYQLSGANLIWKPREENPAT